MWIDLFVIQNCKNYKLKALYTVLFLLMQRIQKNLTRQRAPDMYSCERNLYLFSGFSVLLEIARDMRLQPAREMTFNLKESFVIFLFKKEEFHAQWDSNPQPLN